MNNCLVTKLKSSVNNKSLSKLNVLTIKTKAIDSPTINTQWMCIGASNNGSVSINSPSVGIYKYGITGEVLPYPVNVPANSRIESHFENKDGIIEVNGKYNINEIVFGINGIVRIKDIYGISGTISRLVLRSIEEYEIDVNKLINALNLDKLTEIELPMKGVVSAIDLLNKISKNTIEEFKYIKIINSSFCLLFDETVGLDDIANNVNVNRIEFYQIDASKGNLSSLGKLINLTSLVFSSTKQINGDIMDFINPWIQAGRTSGKINVLWLLGQKNITLNGQPITYPSGVNDSSAYLNWTSDGTVTFTAS